MAGVLFIEMIITQALYFSVFFFRPSTVRQKNGVREKKNGSAWARSHFTITAEVLVLSLAEFHCQYED